MRAISMLHSLIHSFIHSNSRDSVHKPTFLERKGEPKRIVEPGSFRLPAERLSTRPSWLLEPGSFRLPAERLTTRPSRLTHVARWYRPQRLKTILVGTGHALSSIDDFTRPLHVSIPPPQIHKEVVGIAERRLWFWTSSDPAWPSGKAIGR